MTSKLFQIAEFFRGKIPDSHTEDNIQLIQVGEEGIAIEILCTQILDSEIPIPEDVFNGLQAASVRYGIDKCYCEDIAHLVFKNEPSHPPPGKPS